MAQQHVRSVPSLVVALLSLALALVALPSLPAGAQTGEAAVSYSFEGFDGLRPGAPGEVTVTARVDDPGDVDDQEPLRFVGTLASPEGPLADTSLGYRGPGDDGYITLTTDAQGRFFYPPPSQPPLTLEDPLLTSGIGHTSTFELTLPEGSDYRFDVQLVATGEGVGEVVRLFGSGRFETAVEISAATFGPGVPVAYVATGFDFPDALTGGPAAALTDGPILLVGTDFIPDVTAAELERLNPGRIVILGGSAVVDAGVEAQLAGFTSGSVSRLFGPDRFGTAAEIATSAFSSGVDVAYVATGAEFPDALSGGAAAATEGGPVLLALRDQIPAPTVEALRALDPGRIVILGGTGVIGDAVASQLAEFTDGEVSRYFGATRFETSASVSANVFDATAVHTVYVATGLNFPDALTGVPAAGLDGSPLLLVTDQQIPDAVREELERLSGGGFQRAGGGLSVVILGGTAVVGQAVEDELGDFVRTDEPDLGEGQPVGQPAGITFDVREPTPPPPPAASTITLTPAVDTNPPGDPHRLTATVSDQYGDPFPGAGVRFETDGAGGPGPVAGSATTGAEGTATFTFTNTATVTNEVTACTTGDAEAPADCLNVDLLETATATWALQVEILTAESNVFLDNVVFLGYSGRLSVPPPPGAAEQFRIGDVTAVAVEQTNPPGQRPNAEALRVTFPDGTVVHGGGQTLVYEQSAVPAEHITDTDGTAVRSPDSQTINPRPEVLITSPTTESPATVAAGGTFVVSFTTDSPGEYRVDFHATDTVGSFTPFGNGTGTTIVGSNAVTVTVPDSTPAGTYDIRVRVTPASGATGQDLKIALLVVP